MHILKQIFRAIVFLAKQGIPLQGDREALSMQDGKNPSNFLALIKEFAIDDPVLKEHLHTPSLRMLRISSPRTQNEVISIISNYSGGSCCRGEHVPLFLSFG